MRDERYDIKTLSIDRVLNKEHFYGKTIQKMSTKSQLDSFLILVNNPKQPLHAKKRYFERGLSKSLKKVNFFFLSNLVSFNGQSYQKQKGSGTSDQSLFRLQNKFRKIPLLVIYNLTKFDGVI